jgi:hypothetical protein
MKPERAETASQRRDLRVPIISPNSYVVKCHQAIHTSRIKWMETPCTQMGNKEGLGKKIFSDV